MFASGNEDAGHTMTDNPGLHERICAWFDHVNACWLDTPSRLILTTRLSRHPYMNYFWQMPRDVQALMKVLWPASLYMLHQASAKDACSFNGSRGTVGMQQILI